MTRSIRFRPRRPLDDCFQFARALGIEAVGVPANAEDRYQPTPALLDRIDGDLDGLIVASPANPTGTMISADEMAALTGYCDDRGIRLISDEIYHHIVSHSA